MGYERKSLQLLAGGFNCLPPVDKVPIGDYLLAQNWRSDALGKLVSRAGYAEPISIPGAGIAHSAGSAGGPFSPYYVACNSAISSPASSVYFNGGLLASGFDGNRVGFAFANGYAYVMNRGNQGRHGPGGFEAWNLAAPTVAPSAATSTTTPPLDHIVDYTYTSQATTYVHSLTIAGVVYSVVDSGYTPDEIAQILAGYASGDTNCSVSYPGTGPTITIQVVIPNTIIAVSGSDGNNPVKLLAGTASTTPVGTYYYYVTYMSSDFKLESNAAGPSNATTTSPGGGQSNTVTINNTPTDPRVGFINIYRAGGTQSGIYRVGQALASATTFVDDMSDLTATNNGQVMPTTNGPPPAASGIIGPFLGRLYAWSTKENPNRLFYTPANLPQYWNTDPQVGDWADVGLDGEAIVWCTLHSNLLVIYKERSIWILIGDPTTGQIEQAYDGFGLVNAFALAPAGQVDYFVGPGSLCLFDMSQVHQITGNVLPLFNQSIANGGPLTPPGSILPGTAYNSTSNSPYAIALGHAMGRLYVGYAEKSSGTSYNLLVFEEGPTPERAASEYLSAQRGGKWFYHRTTSSGLGFFGFFFDGVNMIGLTGAVGGAALGLSLADFRAFATADAGGAAIECVYQSHYEDCGHPDNDKQFLEIAIDYEFYTGANANVWVDFDNGVIARGQVGNLVAGNTRQTKSFPFSAASFPQQSDAGVLARNISILVDESGTGLAIIHNVYVFYYVEARLAVVASTLPTDLGVGKNKQCKELELDIGAPNGTVSVAVVSDLPGNALTSRQTPTVAQGGRAIWKYPFPVTEGFLWQVVLAGVSNVPFRLYAVRLLMRVLGVYVQAYESAAGFVWDSMQVDLGDPDAKVLDQLRFELDTDPGTGTVNATLLTDLPGEKFATRGTYQLVTQTAATARAWMTVPLPDQGIFGRSIDIQTTGTVGYRLYRVQARWRKIGRYLVGATTAGNNDAFNVFEYDFRSERRKMFKRIEVDMYAFGSVTFQVITDQDGGAPAAVTESFTLTTASGRIPQIVVMPPGVRGRLLRLRLTSTAAVMLYNLRVWTRDVNDPKGVWVWEDFPLEPTDVLPHWSDLIIDETPPKWQWVDVDFAVSDS